MEAIIASIIAYIGLAIKAKPYVEEIYTEGKKLIADLFSKGLISKEKQDSLMSWADEHQRATLAGEIPPEFTVE